MIISYLVAVGLIAKYPQDYQCLNYQSCRCDGTVAVPRPTIYNDEAGERIIIDACPMRDMTACALDLIQQAMIFLRYNVTPTAGGQVEQPVWFWETLDVVKGFIDSKEVKNNE